MNIVICNIATCIMFFSRWGIA